MMYQSLTLYYLNQMGINPWVHKDQLDALHLGHQTTQDLKLILLTPRQPSKKAQLLLNRIMDFIHDLEIQCVLIEFESTHFNRNLKQLHKQVFGSSLAAIMNFGVDLNPYLKGLNLECPLFSHPDPESLLQHLASKKKIYEDLIHIRNVNAC